MRLNILCIAFVPFWKEKGNLLLGICNNLHCILEVGGVSWYIGNYRTVWSNSRSIGS